MASGMFKAILVGNLGSKPEVKFTAGGTAVCNLSVACTERDKVGDKWEDVTTWAKVTAWGKTAELCGEYLDKGRQVFVEGRVRERKWKDKDGAERTSFEVTAERVLFLGGKQDGQPTTARAAAKAARNPAPDDGQPLGKDDIPF